jgi:SHS family lactate transporter-like MFS transporter
LLYPYIGWRGMFFVGIVPALLVLYVRARVPESPAWQSLEKQQRVGLLDSLRRHWWLSLYAIVLMTAFNFFSHGTQDLYPTFLRVQHHFDPHTVSLITIALNVGAIAGGLFFGAMSERIGRRRAICIAALIALPVLPLWAFASTALALGIGAFLMQIAVQGAWGVIPAHLNEISPGEIRATFPGFVYQLGNLLASGNATLQAMLAERHGNDYAYALALVCGIVAVAIAVLILLGHEQRGVDMVQAPG